jgi:guanylate kinase
VRVASDFDAIVVNDDLSRAVDEVAAILKARRDRQ